MEKANFFMNDGYGIEIHGNELNCANSDQLQNCFFNPNWQNTTSIVQNSDPFESALSSMVSSPATSNAIPSNGNGGGSGGGDNFVLRELIGRLGSICNSGEMSPNSYINNGNNNSTNTSCYSTPLNSPPKLNLSMMDHHPNQNQNQIRVNNLSHHGGNYPMINVNPNMSNLSADPGFAERAARFSCFAGTNNLNESEFLVNRQQQVVVPKLEPGKLSRVSSNQSLKVLMSGSHQLGVQEFKDGGISAPHNSELVDSRENSSVSEQIPVGQNGSNSRKRKSVSKAKAKDANANVSSGNNDISNVKRSKSEENNENDKDDEKVADDQGNQKQSKDNQKLPEPLKDYIHVRARRGQATDAHSLAERVRREKISERMKLLQDLVPGCNKVTGKAVMLDEIINYVQSLQRQVEFLSMKLATVNPSMEFNMETLLSKDMFQSIGSLQHNMYQSETSAQEFPYGLQSQQGPNLHSGLHKGTESHFSINPLNPNLVRKPSMLLPSLDGFVEPNSQVPTFFEDDLHSVVQMGFGQNQTHNFPGDMATSQMKAEL